jgi:hypothetical protein
MQAATLLKDFPKACLSLLLRKGVGEFPGISKGLVPSGEPVLP